MQRKKMTLRFDLDRPEDRRAWEYLQGLNAVSLNRTVLAIINQAERVSLMKDELRNIIREELSTILERASVQPVRTEPVESGEMDDTIMGFLENFS